jgi:hypothetical protein
MLLKSSIAAAAVIVAVMSLSRVDYRELYDGMYPVNGLRRDVLHLCQDSKPTFVRALQTDRVNCYDSMPDPVEMAIGWVRTTSRLAAMRRPTAVELAEKLLVEATMPGGEDLLAPRRFTGYAAQPAAVRPCKPMTLTVLAEDAGRALAAPDDPALAVLGLMPPSDTVPRATTGGGDAASGLLDVTAAAALGDSGPLPPVGCRTPA